MFKVIIGTLKFSADNYYDADSHVGYNFMIAKNVEKETKKLGLNENETVFFYDTILDKECNPHSVNIKIYFNEYSESMAVHYRLKGYEVSEENPD